MIGRRHLRGRRMQRFVAAIALALVPTLTTAPAAQAAVEGAYPSRPLVLVVPFSPGGVADTLARVIGERLEARLGQPVVIENKAGAAGNIASEYVARAAPDGHTLLIGATSITILPSTRDGAPDPSVAFVPVTKLVTQPILIAAKATFAPRSLRELVVLARSEPQRLTYATAGVGTTDHLAAALLWARANVDALHVPYPNSAQEIKDLMNGEVQLAFITLGAVRAMLNNGTLKAIAVTSPQRIAALPEVPTVAESGYPGFEVTSWFGLLAPAGTSAEIVNRLQREVARILTAPEVREKLIALGAEPVGNTSLQFADEIKAQLKLWPPIIKAAGIPRE
jgi:tripartite-type tricarboxylate transporter receptor subunit TctC